MSVLAASPVTPSASDERRAALASVPTPPVRRGRPPTNGPLTSESVRTLSPDDLRARKAFVDGALAKAKADVESAASRLVDVQRIHDETHALVAAEAKRRRAELDSLAGL